MYVKLFGSILDSSIWATDLGTRVVWITMLTMADEYGIVYASLDGLANRARISVPECRKALRVLLSGDRMSRTKNDRGTKLEGRRIEAVEGGWQVINYRKYRELRSRRQIADAARQARHRRQAVMGRDMAVTGVTSHDVTVEAEAEAEAETTKASAPKTRGGTWLTPFCMAWEAAYGGTPAGGELAKHLRALTARYPAETVLTHWRRYLEATEAKYANPARFAQTYGAWAPGESTPTVVQYQTADEADRKAGILP